MNEPGVVYIEGGLNWCCMVCEQLGCSPSDLAERPVMMVVAGFSVCQVHQPFMDCDMKLVSKAARLADDQGPKFGGQGSLPRKWRRPGQRA